MDTENQAATKHTHLRKWAAILAVPAFLLATGLFAFLWNIPLNTLATPVPETAVPEIRLKADPASGRPEITMTDSLARYVRTVLTHYLTFVNNAGHVDPASYAPLELEIRMGTATIGMSEELMVFNFDTKYGFRIQTSKKPDEYDLSIFRYLKGLMQMEQDCSEQR